MGAVRCSILVGVVALIILWSVTSLLHLHAWNTYLVLGGDSTEDGSAHNAEAGQGVVWDSRWNHGVKGKRNRHGASSKRRGKAVKNANKKRKEMRANAVDSNAEEEVKKMPSRPKKNKKKSNGTAVGSNVLHRVPDHPTSSPSSVPPKSYPCAYASIISNMRFVDGALVLAASLRRHSAHLQSGHCRLVLLYSAGKLSQNALSRLSRVGRYNELIPVEALAARCPVPDRRDTFDKLYVFNLTQYERVVFMDADMLFVGNVDPVLNVKLPSPRHVGAIGGHGNRKAKTTSNNYGSYFQTGFMLIAPDAEVFAEIKKEFDDNSPPKRPKGRYNTPNARDGVLLRNYFGDNFVIIDNKYSRNLNPRYNIERRQQLVGLHFRGTFKPWFDRYTPYVNSDFGKKEFGYAYQAWWTMYEAEIHTAEINGTFVDPYVEAAGGEEGGKVEAADDVKYAMEVPSNEFKNPLLRTSAGASTAGSTRIMRRTHVWMMRECGAKDEYAQLTVEEETRRLSYTPDGVTLVVGPRGQSCDDVCQSHATHNRCHNDTLYLAPINSCPTLRENFGCQRCELGVYWRHHPGNDFPGLTFGDEEAETGSLKPVAGGKKGARYRSEEFPVCRYNFLHDSRSFPSCQARHNDTRRLCPCR